jgi:hypothetical protein
MRMLFVVCSCGFDNTQLEIEEGYTNNFCVVPLRSTIYDYIE